MKTKKQRYVIMYLIEKHDIGYEFHPAKYPLHLTLIPSFRLDKMTKEITEKIKYVCKLSKPTQLEAIKEERFGPNKEVIVTVFQKSETLNNLHRSLCELLENSGAEFDEPQYMLENYRPHATTQKSGGVDIGSTVNVDSVSILDKLPGGDPEKRKILATIDLAH